MLATCLQTHVLLTPFTTLDLAPPKRCAHEHVLQIKLRKQRGPVILWGVFVGLWGFLSSLFCFCFCSCFCFCICFCFASASAFSLASAFAFASATANRQLETLQLFPQVASFQCYAACCKDSVLLQVAPFQRSRPSMSRQEPNLKQEVK